MKHDTNPFKAYEEQIVKDYKNQLSGVKNNIEESKSSLTTMVNVMDIYTDRVFSVVSKILGSK
jgi:BMFP domain-containing protein YqiC